MLHGTPSCVMVPSYNDDESDELECMENCSSYWCSLLPFVALIFADDYGGSEFLLGSTIRIFLPLMALIPCWWLWFPCLPAGYDSPVDLVTLILLLASWLLFHCRWFWFPYISWLVWSRAFRSFHSIVVLRGLLCMRLHDLSSLVYVVACISQRSRLRSHATYELQPNTY